MNKIGLIGYGSIARAVVETFRASARSDAIVGVLTRKGRAGELHSQGIAGVERLSDLLSAGPDIIAETAGQGAAREYGEAILNADCDLLITSVGILADEDFFKKIRRAALRSGRRVLLPSGAIGGIDALTAMRKAGLFRVTYRSRKPSAAWIGSPAENIIDLHALKDASVFYRGTARVAAARFPKNANVAATVALAGLGMDATEVELIADPEAGGNIHEIEAEGVSGRMFIRLDGNAFPGNPRSSMLTAYSVVKTLMNIDETIQV